MLVIGVVITAVFVILAIFAPWIAPYGFAQSSADGVRFPKAGAPSGDHWFGTDRLFFDVLSRVIWGARTAIEVVVLSIVFCVVIGVPLGLVSGYYGGWMDRVLVLIMDAIFAFPSFLLAIVFSFLLTDIFGGSVLAVALSLTAIYIPQYFRVVRNTTVSAKEAAYVEAARAMGAKDGVDHAPLPVRQRHPERARARHPERRRRDPHAGRAWASSVWASSRPTPPSGGMTSTGRSSDAGSGDLVDRPLPGPGDRAPGDRADPGGRGRERDHEPDAAAPPAAAGRDAGRQHDHRDGGGALTWS